MRKSIVLAILLVILTIGAFAGARAFYYYSDNPLNAYTPPDRPLRDIEYEAAASSDRLEAPDNPTVSKGVVVVDYAHRNAYFLEELNTLLSKVVARGYSYELVLNSDDEASTASSDAKGDSDSLADKLRYADALILPLPQVEYTPEEVAAIERFVEKGGRLLIIGDPTRTVVVEALNSIASSFGVVYINDYLYSLENNDNNYRNVIYRNFRESPITQGLGPERQVIFYGGGSINAPGHEIILGDETTHSSTSEGGRTMASAVLTTDDRVLALGDFTFFSEPYSAAEGNGTLINNIADFISSGQRDFELPDFPYFLDSQVDVVFEDTQVFNSQFENSVKLKQLLEASERSVNYVNTLAETENHDVIFVGRFSEAKAVENYLNQAGITIMPLEEKKEQEPDLADSEAASGPVVPIRDMPAQDEEEEGRFVLGRIRIEGVGDLERGGSTLFYLNKEQDRNVLVILSDNPSTNADAFDILLDNELDDCRISARVAVCQTEEPDGGLPPSLRSPRIDNILLVASDIGRPRDDQRTGLVEFRNALSDTYSLDTWLISQKESPDIDELLNYDAVIWASGDYWDDSINEEDAALLSKYIEIGGNLILSGASIAFDWDHTDFLTNVAHADYTGTGEQTDLEVALPDHPIANGFAEGEVITLTNSVGEEALEIDIVENTPDAQVIFQRGPDSKESGAASVIAYEDDRVKVAFFAFPIYLVPGEQQALLIDNTVSWFSKKPLDLPRGTSSTDDEADKEQEEEEQEEDATGDETDQEEENGDQEEDTGNGDDENGENNEDPGDEGENGEDNNDSGDEGENGEASDNG